MTHRPTVPPENRSPKGTGDTGNPGEGQVREIPDREAAEARNRTIAENTHHQGYQQDR